MSATPSKITQASIILPAVPVLAVNARSAALLSPEGEIAVFNHERAQVACHGKPVMVCHAPYTRHRLGADDLFAFDVLELFAFARPASFCTPTPAGLAAALGLSAPTAFEDMPLTIREAAQALLSDLQTMDNRAALLEIVRVMGLQGKGWHWAPFVFTALGETYDPAVPPAAKTALAVWKALPEWAEDAPPPPPAHHPVTGEESRARLKELLGFDAEARQAQVDYATALTSAFSPKNDEDEPHMILAEAGTGTGKTLGYLAPASVWAEKNDGAVWVSTYTKNLQRQIGQELDRLYPDATVKDAKTAVRKGRENYLCLLNLEDTAVSAGLARTPQHAIAAGLMARWAGATADGDLQGGDFPGWLPGLLGYQYTRGLADRRGECIHGACDHYHRCFVERAVRKAQRADIVVANHALVMAQTALAGPDGDLPRRYVFDEGHHLFDAADSAFSAHLSATETAELRRWLLGPEGGKRSRARGLKRRVEDLIAGDTESEALIEHILHEARALAGPGWSKRFKDGTPQGAAEEFLLLVYKQVMARADGRGGPYSLETQTLPLIEGAAAAAQTLAAKLCSLQKPLRTLAARLRRALADNADTWDTDTRKRVEAVCAGIDRRSEHMLAAWIGMLETLQQTAPMAGFVDWMEIERLDGQSVDVSLSRHWIDPMIPFAAALKPHAHGIAVTSATLRDRSGDEDADWKTACLRTGATGIAPAAGPAIFSAASPYDYAAQTRIFVINDVRKDDMDQVAAAYRVLFDAAGGGGLGLFTAIQRLRAVHQRILLPLEEAGITLYAQHADGMDTGTLVDMFRTDTHACLLGTDAVRDGIDVPGESLRLVVYDRVPWPRPDILHKARREAFGKKDYDEMTARFRLRQAYGRLIRRANDRGVFVMMDGALPSRLQSAFPEGVTVEKTGLADCAQKIRVFLGTEKP